MKAPRNPKTPPAKTVLSEFEPLSQEERAEIETKRREQWFEQNLLYLLAMGESNRGFAQTLCEKVGAFARENKCSKIIRGALKRERPGRPSGHTDAWQQFMVLHYAAGMSLGNGEPLSVLKKNAINSLIKHYQRAHGVRISHRGMDNQLTTAISKTNTDELPESIRRPIEKRKARGRARSERAKNPSSK